MQDPDHGVLKLPPTRRVGGCSFCCKGGGRVARKRAKGKAKKARKATRKVTRSTAKRKAAAKPKPMEMPGPSPTPAPSQPWTPSGESWMPNQ